MISYQLAMELKEAGYPQRGVGFGFSHNPQTGELLHHYTLSQLPEIKAPTVSELIEALGDNLTWLERKDEKLWSAVRGVILKGERLYNTEVIAHGVEEALGRLWLATQDKANATPILKTEDFAVDFPLAVHPEED